MSILSFLCFWYFACVGILGHFRFMLSVPVQLIAWKDRPRNDQLCVVRDIKRLLTHSLAHDLRKGKVRVVGVNYVELCCVSACVCACVYGCVRV